MLNKIETKEFVLQTGKKNNLFLSKVLIIGCLIGPLLGLLHFIAFLDIPYTLCVLELLVGLISTGIYHVFLFKTDKTRFTTVIGLLSIILMIVSLGWSSKVEFYLSFLIIPLISCIYLSPGFSIGMSVTGYFSMAFCLWCRSLQMFVNEDELVDWLGKKLGGYSLEFAIVTVITVFITKMLREKLLEEHEQKLRIEKIQAKLIQSFANIVEWNDEFTGQHIKRTSRYVEIISKRLVEKGFYKEELNPHRIELLVKAAPLHDLGKISVPNSILCKPGKLTDEEFEIMKKHSTVGYEIIKQELAGIEDEEYVQIAEDMALYHHEKWNGCGYPTKTAGTDIPLSARIMAAADVLDALLSKRQYKEAFTLEKTMQIFKESSGTQFEPCIVETVLSLQDEIKEICK